MYDDNMDSLICYSPCRMVPSPEACYINYHSPCGSMVLSLDSSLICISQSVPRSPEYELSLWNFSDENVISSTQPHVHSPSPPFRDRGQSQVHFFSQEEEQFKINILRFLDHFGQEQLLQLLQQRHGQEIVQQFFSQERQQQLNPEIRLQVNPEILNPEIRLQVNPEISLQVHIFSHEEEQFKISILRFFDHFSQEQLQQLLQQRHGQELVQQFFSQERQQRLQQEQINQEIRLQELKKLNLLKFVLRCLLNQNQKVREVKKLNLVKFEHKVLQQLEEFVLVQELDRLQNENRELHKFIQHASQITLQIKINMAHEICEEGHDNSSIEILDKMTVVADILKFHLSWTKAPCRHRSLANDGDLKKSCTSFDGCHMHQDCMSTAKLEIYVEHHIERFQGALSSHIEHRFVRYARKIELQSFHAIGEPIASADDQPDSRCELTYISHSTKSPPGPNGLLDGEEMLQQDSLKHQLVGETHAMNDGENMLSDSGIQSAFSYPENEGNSKKSRKIKRKITLEDLQHFSGRRKDAAKSFAVSVSTIKRLCRKNGIADWRYRTIDENIQSLSKPKDIIESIQGEGAEMGNQMAGGSRSCERELNHEQIGFLPESEKDSDRSQIRIGLMEDSSTQMEITPAADILVFSPHEQCIEEGDPLELIAQPSELNFSDACLRPDAINFTQIDHNISATVAFDIEESSQTNLTRSAPAPKLAEATAAHVTALVTEMKDTRTVTMKATYGEDMIRFPLSLTSGIIELRKEVAERLMLEVGTFRIKYLDDDEDWILMTGDKDLQECFNISVSLGRKVIKLSIHEITPS